MHYRLTSPVSAMQFTGDNLHELGAFISAETSVRLSQSWRRGADAPAEFSGDGGFQLVVHPNEWAVVLDRQVSVVGDAWFREHYAPVA